MAKKISFKGSVMLNPLVRTRGQVRHTGADNRWTTHCSLIIEKHMTGTTGARLIMSAGTNEPDL